MVSQCLQPPKIDKNSLKILSFYYRSWEYSKAEIRHTNTWLRNAGLEVSTNGVRVEAETKNCAMNFNCLRLKVFICLFLTRKMWNNKKSFQIMIHIRSPLRFYYIIFQFLKSSLKSFLSESSANQTQKSRQDHETFIAGRKMFFVFYRERIRIRNQNRERRKEKKLMSLGRKERSILCVIVTCIHAFVVVLCCFLRHDFSLRVNFFSDSKRWFRCWLIQFKLLSYFMSISLLIEISWRLVLIIFIPARAVYLNLKSSKIEPQTFFGCLWFFLILCTNCTKN